MKATERFECLRCGKHFNHHSGFVKYGCPYCGHPYVKWLTFPGLKFTPSPVPGTVR